MSKFFQNYEDEKQEMTKKTTEIVEKSQEKLTKKEQKLNELTKKIEEIRGAGKNFEKLFKKFMNNEVKKFTPYFENNEIPENLHAFLKEERIKASKPMKEIAEDFLSLFNTNINSSINNISIDNREINKDNTNTINITKNINTNTKNKIDSILKLEDDNLKEKELLQLEDKNTEAFMALFSIYYRMKRPAEMMKTLREIINKTAILNLDVYLGKIYELIEESNYEEYNELLHFLLNNSNSISNNISDNNNINNSNINDNTNNITNNISDNMKRVVEKRNLEFVFFKMNQCPQNDDPLFSLLYYTRKQEWDKALQHYDSHIFMYNKMTVPILIEFANFAVKNRHFELAFSIYVKSTGINEDYIIEIYALCVILNSKLIGDEHFSNFLELFRQFDSNPLCLPSRDPLLEICRAFYCLNILDFVTASSILEEVVGFYAMEELEESSKRIYSILIK